MGNLAQVWDKRNLTRDYTHDQLGRITLEEWAVASGPPSRTFTFTYSALSEMLTAADSGASSEGALEWTYTYDLLSRVDTATYEGPLGLDEVLYDYDYHGDGRLKQFRVEYDPSGGTQTVLYNDLSYDELGRLVTLVEHGADVGNKHVRFEYNAEGQLTLVERYTGLPTSSPVLVGSSVYEYDHPAGWLTEITHRKANEQTITAYGYAYETSGRLASQTLTSGGQTATRNYDYDETDQLTGVTNASAQTLEDYEYDATGNRTGSHLAASYQTDHHNRLVDDGTYTYTYDGEGNLASRTRTSDGQFTQYHFDHRNRLTAVVTKVTSAGAETERVEYLYDQADRRVARIVDADGAGAGEDAYTHYLFDDRASVVLELADADGADSAPADVTHRYLHGAAVDQVLSDEADSGGGTQFRWALSDHQGSVRDLADSAGAVLKHREFDSFGRITADTAPAMDLLFGYTGREWDAEVDLYYYRARWYEPTTGRFLSEDPARDDQNLYRYARNNAVNAVDPTGLATMGLGGNNFSSGYKDPMGGFEIVWGNNGTMTGVVPAGTSAQSSFNWNNVSNVGLTFNTHSGSVGFNIPGVTSPSQSSNHPSFNSFTNTSYSPQLDLTMTFGGPISSAFSGVVNMQHPAFTPSHDSWTNTLVTPLPGLKAVPQQLVGPIINQQTPGTFIVTADYVFAHGQTTQSSNTSAGINSHDGAFSPGDSGLPGLFSEAGKPYLPPQLQSGYVPFASVSVPLMTFDGMTDLVHLGLDVAGSVDPTPFSDGLNALIYAFQGDTTNAGISLAGAFLPVWGDFGKAIRLAPDVGGAVGGTTKIVPPPRAPSATPGISHHTPTPSYSPPQMPSASPGLTSYSPLPHVPSFSPGVTQHVPAPISPGEHFSRTIVPSVTDLSSRTIASFTNGNVVASVTDAETTMYRVFGGESGRVGSYLTLTPPTSSAQAINDLALNPEWGNTVSFVTTVRVPAGTPIYHGTAAQQGSLTGGGSQVFIPREWLFDEMFGDVTPLH